MRITRKLLEGKKACGDQVDIFTKEWSEECEVTKANLLRAAVLHLDLDWFAIHFLSPTLLAEYRKQMALLVAEFERQKAPLVAEFERQRAPLVAEYVRQVAPLRAEIERQVAPLRAEIERQRALLVWELWLKGERC